LTSSWYR